MAYISNTNKKVKWGIDTGSGPLMMPSSTTANSTSPVNMDYVRNNPLPAAPKPESVSPTQYRGITGVSSNVSPGNSTYSAPAPTSQNRSTPTGLTGLLSGLDQLAAGLKSYQARQSTSQPAGLVQTPEPSQFSQFTSGLMDASSPSSDQRGLLSDLRTASRRGREIGEEARRISDMYGSEIARVGNLGAGAVAGAKTTGTDPVGRGNAAIAAESASNRISALSAAQAAALQGTQQQLTGAEQGITGITNALTGANTQQQLAQQALATGGQLALPSPAAYGQTVFDPVTGTYTGAGGNLDPQVQAQNLAQQVLSGAMTYDQAIASLGYAGTAGTNFLNNALTAQGGNPLQLQAQNAAQQANIATQGTAGTEIARQGLQQATQDYISTNTAAEFAHDQARAVVDILARTGLNNVSSTDYNRALREVQQRFSDVDRTALNTALIEAQVAYTNLLSTGGGTPTGREEQALGTLNIDSSAAAINASIQELENAVARRLQAQYGALQQYNQNLGTGSTVGGGSGSIWDW